MKNLPSPRPTKQLGPLLAEAKSRGFVFWMKGSILMIRGQGLDDDLRGRLKAARWEIAQVLNYPEHPCAYHWGSPAHPCVRCGESYRDHLANWYATRSDNVVPFPVVIE